MAAVSPSARKTVYIVGGGASYQRMYQEKGWAITSDLKQADLLQFTGGEDVSPSLYGEGLHSRSVCNPLRDKREKILYHHALANGVPMAGICRGGQFLNVMAGGKMWQDVNNHAASHPAYCELTDTDLEVTSTHHQMMRPTKASLVLLSASECTQREKIGRDGVVMSSIKIDPDPSSDIEAVYYEEQNTLCFQPHPEFNNCHALRELYFTYIEEMLFDIDMMLSPKKG